MTRRPFITGNWKMNGDIARTRDLCLALAKLAPGWATVDVAVCPPFVALQTAATNLSGSGIQLGAQNMHEAPSGAFTGEVSAGMLLTVGCQLVILGHSERRHLFGETDETVSKKVQSALTAGLRVIVCVGEKLEEREQHQTVQVVERQVAGALKDVQKEQMEAVIIAYEPVWAIGTGKVATVAQAGEVHRQIRIWVAGKYGAEVADKLRIQYGGSVKADNAKRLLSDPDIDGALVGGASLDPNEFDSIIRAAM